MHPSALQLGGAFLQAYARPGAVVVDLGAYDVNGSLRSVCPAGVTYVGLDMEAGPGVDLVVEPGQPLPLADGYADLVVSSSAFEHDAAFWMTFLDLVRITRTGGFIYLNVPSNGHVHSHPEDCWRFYPDAGRALERWARSQGRPATLVESFVGERHDGFWNDFVAVFAAGEPAGAVTFLSDAWPAANIRRLGEAGVLRPRQPTEDMLLHQRAAAELARARALGVEPLDHELIDLLTLHSRPPVSEARPAWNLGPVTPAGLMDGLIDRLDGHPPEPVTRNQRQRPLVIEGWVAGDGFDPAAEDSRRYLLLRSEAAPGASYLADLGEPVPRPDLPAGLPQLEPRFTERAGFARSIDLRAVAPGAYRLGFLLVTGAGVRGRMVAPRLQVD